MAPNPRVARLMKLGLLLTGAGLVLAVADPRLRLVGSVIAGLGVALSLLVGSLLKHLS